MDYLSVRVVRSSDIERGSWMHAQLCSSKCFWLLWPVLGSVNGNVARVSGFNDKQHGEHRTSARPEEFHE